jgi:hypothetical protein
LSAPAAFAKLEKLFLVRPKTHCRPCDLSILRSEPVTLTLNEARLKACRVMQDDQLQAIENLIRVILANPEDPGLPLVTPSPEPQTGVHVVAEVEPPIDADVDLPADVDEESSLPDAPGNVPTYSMSSSPPMTDYERGWRAGRGAAVRALEDLRDRASLHTVEEKVFADALRTVTDLEAKVSP